MFRGKCVCHGRTTSDVLGERFQIFIGIFRLFFFFSFRFIQYVSVHVYYASRINRYSYILERLFHAPNCTHNYVATVHTYRKDIMQCT